MTIVAALREAPRASSPAGPAGDSAPEPAHAAEVPGRIVCAQCGSQVTSAGDKLVVGGRHAHRFLNPDGLEFEIACFRSAPGALAAGQSSSVWTWFPGYVWQAVVCRGCLRHLGWSYARADDRFFGLITDRIVELPALSA